MAKTNMGLDENIAGALTYLLGFLTGLFFFFTEKKNQFVRFHAAQSIVVFGGLFIISIILSSLAGAMMFGGFAFGAFAALFGLLNTLVTLISLGLWLYLMYKAYNGQKPRIPVAADIADNLM